MRDHLVLTINGARQIVRAPDAFLSLSDFLRRRLGLIGTKIVCSEGDCGACTVLIGRPPYPPPSKGGARGGIPAHASSGEGDEPTLLYRPVDSCIQFMFQLDGTHIVTVEGLRPDGQLNPVQQAMVDCHGSQCGFCTPGFVMSMTGLLENEEDLDDPDWRRGLTGNLCRCTGYTPILDAALQACEADRQRLNDLYPPAPILAGLAATAADPVELTSPPPASPLQRAGCPATLAEALTFLAANPDARIIAGATDVGVRTNKSGRLPPVILDLNRIAELDFVSVANKTLTCGARASWTSILNACSFASPEFARILTIFGAPQIRHVGTIGGNIANASPIADSLPFLYVTEATLVLASSAGRREININDFYHGYKQLDLKPGELIAEVRIPLPEPDETLKLYKVSRRRDLDISTFTAAIRLRLNPPPSKGRDQPSTVASGDRAQGGSYSAKQRGGIPADSIADSFGAVDEPTIASASIAFGGVGPTVLRARKTEAFLAGQPLTLETMAAAADLAASEVTTISDVRGAADYRRQLTRNILLKFYHQTQADPVTV